MDIWIIEKSRGYHTIIYICLIVSANDLDTESHKQKKKKKKNKINFGKKKF